ncbi:MAG: HAD hydrolase-like protein [Merdibacter sp.]
MRDADGGRPAYPRSLLLVIVGIAGIIGVWDRLFRRFWPFRREKPAVIFDLDGTLIDSRALVDASFVHTMHELKPSYIVTKQDKDAFFGPPLQVSFARYFDSEAEVNHAVDVYRAYNKAHHDELVTLFDGVEDVLRTLKERGCSLGVMSNKKRDIVDMGLSHTGIGRYIDAVLGGDEIDRPKPDPQGILRVCGSCAMTATMCMSGIPSDIEAAKNMAARRGSCRRREKGGTFSIALIHD